MTAMTYSAANLAAAATVAYGFAIGCDRATAKAADAKQAWAMQAALGLSLKAPDVALTLDDVKAGLLDAARAKATSAKARAAIKGVNDISPTAKGWFYDLKRVFEKGLLPAFISGKASLTTLRRATESDAPQGGPRKDNGKDTAPPATPPAPLPVIQPSSLDSMADQMELDAKRMSVKAMRAQQLAISRIMAAAATMTRRIEAAIAAEVKAKANKASRAKAVAA